VRRKLFLEHRVGTKGGCLGPLPINRGTKEGGGEPRGSGRNDPNPRGGYDWVPFIPLHERGRGGLEALDVLVVEEGGGWMWILGGSHIHKGRKGGRKEGKESKKLLNPVGRLGKPNSQTPKEKGFEPGAHFGIAGCLKRGGEKKETSGKAYTTFLPNLT